jgi:hypothetical protein
MASLIGTSARRTRRPWASWRLPAGPSSGAAALGLPFAVVLAAQLPIALVLSGSHATYAVPNATGVLALNAVLAASTAMGAAFLPPRRRALALLPGGVLAGATLLGAATVGGHLPDIAMAGLTLLAAWWVGRAALRLLPAPGLAGVAVIEVAVGMPALALAVLALGRLGVLAWWSCGVVAVGLGLLGARAAAGEAWRRRQAAWAAVVGSPLGTTCAGLLLLQLACAVVWLSAPEIQYDALAGKAYLPQLWASSGSIGPLLIHPVLNFDAGLAALLAVPGHAVGAGDIGRDLQALAWLLLVATVWWTGRRSPAGPVAALLVGIAPQLVWQATTAYDDLLLTLPPAALALALLQPLVRPEAPPGRGFGTAVAVGLLGAACVWAKLHLLAMTGLLLLGWVLLRSAPGRMLALRAAGVALGLAAALPALLLRWADTGNPVFPAYNAIFKSPHYPPIDDHYNFPFWPQAHWWDALRAPYEAVVHPDLMIQGTPPGGLGLLVAALVGGLLLGWRGVRREGIAVWLALVAGTAIWWVHFRDLRYLLPMAAIAVLLLLAQLRDWRPARAVTAGLLAAAAFASAVYLPSTVASFWNVPNRTLPLAAAFGRWSADDYLRRVFPEREALLAYQRIAPPGADAISTAHERLFLDGRDLAAPWELNRLLQLSGPLPNDPDDAYRRLRRLGIAWAVVEARSRRPVRWLPGLLAAHGQRVFAGGGWEVYRLRARPSSSPP